MAALNLRELPADYEVLLGTRKQQDLPDHEPMLREYLDFSRSPCHGCGYV